MSNFLDKEGLDSLWEKLDTQNSLIVNKIKEVKLSDPKPSNNEALALEDEAAAGSSTEYSRADHIHPMPTYEDVGAAPYRKCIVCGYESAEEDGSWRIFADTAVTYGKTSITFLVKQTDQENIGILEALADLDTGTNSLTWILKNGILDLEKYGLIKGDNEISLAVKCKQNEAFVFEVLEEHNNVNDKESSWNLYDLKANENGNNSITEEITYSTLGLVQNTSAAAKKLEKTIQINDTDFDGTQTVRLKNSFNYEFGTHNDDRYTTFCKIPLNLSNSSTTAANSVTLLVSDIAQYDYMLGGVWLIQAGVKGSIQEVKITQLSAPYANGTKFGYYKTATDLCLYVFRKAKSGSFNITVLKQGNSKIEKEDWAYKQEANNTEVEILKPIFEQNICDFLDSKTSYYNHNGIFRGKKLDYSVEDFCQKIEDEDFSNLYLGDYISVNITPQLPDETNEQETVELMIGGFYTNYNVGDTALTKPHVLLLPRGAGFKKTAKMNEENVTTEGYANSYMNTTVLPAYAEALKAVFNTHLLSHKELLTTSVNNKVSDKSEWKDVDLCLMNEVQVFGTTAWSSSPYDIGSSCNKLPVFNFINPTQYSQSGFWLRSVVSDTDFAIYQGSGIPSYTFASSEQNVRPYFLVG